MALRVLVVCTANVCRSPMAGAMLAAMCAEQGAQVEVHTAGIDVSALGVDPRAVALMFERGLDIGNHRPRQLDADAVQGADLILCMTRHHLRHVAATHPGSFPRTFTVRELARRIALRPEGSAFALASLHEGRTAAQLLGDAPDDDIDDPHGRAATAYFDCLDTLDDALGTIAVALRSAGGAC